MKKIKHGMSNIYTAKQYNIPSSTIFTWTDKKNHPGKITGFKRRRKKKKINQRIFDDSKGTYCYCRIVEGLILKYGVVMFGNKVLKIMKKYNLMA